MNYDELTTLVNSGLPPREIQARINQDLYQDPLAGLTEDQLRDGIKAVIASGFDDELLLAREQDAAESQKRTSRKAV